MSTVMSKGKDAPEIDSLDYNISTRHNGVVGPYTIDNWDTTKVVKCIHQHDGDCECANDIIH